MLKEWLALKLGEYLTKIVITILILLIGFMIGKLLRRITQKILHQIELDRLFSKIGFVASVEEFISRIIELIIYFISAIMAINNLGFTKIVLYAISGAVLLTLIITFFLGMKDLFPNLIAGMNIYRKNKIKKGQIISIAGVEGEVEEVNLVETRIRTINGDTIYIPNSLFQKQRLIIKKDKFINQKH